MMKLSIAKCSKCKKVRLVDKTPEGNICFACKQRAKKKKILEGTKQAISQ